MKAWHNSGLCQRARYRQNGVKPSQPGYWSKGRKPLPLSPAPPRVGERTELTEKEKQGAIETFFTIVREELDIIPALVQVKRIPQEKAVFLEKAEPGEASQEKRIIKAAELPKHPIPESAVTVSMLAWIIIAKYCDALPLHSQEKILPRCLAMVAPSPG